MADQEIAEFLHGVVGAVEANGFERMCLWQEERRDGRQWKESLSGIGTSVGELDGRPVFLSLLVDQVRGHRILFWHATSQVVDHEMIRRWLKANLPETAKEDDRWRMVDAMNFHNVFPRSPSHISQNQRADHG